MILARGVRAGSLREGGMVRARLCLPGGQCVFFAARVLSVRVLRRVCGLWRRWEARLSFAGGDAARVRERLYQVIDAFCADEMLVHLEDHRRALAAYAVGFASLRDSSSSVKSSA